VAKRRGKQVSFPRHTPRARSCVNAATASLCLCVPLRLSVVWTPGRIGVDFSLLARGGNTRVMNGGTFGARVHQLPWRSSGLTAGTFTGRSRRRPRRRGQGSGQVFIKSKKKKKTGSGQVQNFRCSSPASVEEAPRQFYETE
jgi:hypothetical protein